MLLPLAAVAQDEVEFTADRPGVGTGTGITPKGKVMWENGMAFDYNKFDETAVKTFTFANSLVRYGISNSVELRLELDGVHESCDGEGSTGLAPVIVGTKVKLYQGEGVKPSVALLANMTLPVASKAFRPSYLAPSLYALADHDVTDRINLTYNLGLEWDGENAAPTTFAAVCCGYTINDRLGAYVESYNYFPNAEKAQCFMDLGVNYMVSRRVQLDLATAFSLNHFDRYSNVSLGVAWLIN